MTLGDVKARRGGSARMPQIAIHHLAEAGARKDRFPRTDHLDVYKRQVSKEIRLIAEQHSDIVARLPYVEEQAEIKSRVRVLERVVSNPGAEIDKLKKAE